MKKTTEMEPLNLDDLDVEELERRLELATAFPSWCCTVNDTCQSKCTLATRLQ